MENTSTAAVSPSSVGIRYGILAGLVMIIISFILNISELDQSPARWLTSVILVAAIVLAQLFFKQQNGGFLNYGQGLGIGSVVAAVAGVLSALYSYIHVNFIDPDFAGRILEKTRADMEAKGTLSDEQIEQGLVWTAKFLNGPLLIITVVVFTLLIGFLASLIISAIIKNPRPEFE